MVSLKYFSVRAVGVCFLLSLHLTDLEAQKFVPVTPCRVADTRNPAGPLGGPALL
jgi:hypothetical protein